MTVNELQIRVGGGAHLGILDQEPSELAWQDDALCRQVDPELFFPEKGGGVKDAKRVCAVCPVRAECLEYALAHDERYGVYGGTSERQRRRIKAARRAA